jgi:hypothetical protein
MSTSSGNQPPDQSGQDRAKPASSDLREQILGSLKPRRGKKTEEWLMRVSGYRSGAAQSQVGMVPSERPAASGITNHTLAQVLDQLFDCFTRYQCEYNDSCTSPELKVEIERPQLMASNQRDPVTGEPVRYWRGRLFTQVWTLLLREHGQDIEGYIVANELAIRFTAHPGDFTRFLNLTSSPAAGGRAWSVNGQALAWDDVPALSRELFHYLLKIAGGEIGSGAPFAVAPVPAPQAALPAQPLLHEENSAVASGGQLPSPVWTLATDGDLKDVPIAKTLELVGSTSAVAIACTLLAEAVERELADLALDGQRAFAAQDTNSAERALRRTARLRAIRPEILASVAKWKDALSDDK